MIRIATNLTPNGGKIDKYEKKRRLRMQDINARIGLAIHTYRKARGMTLDALAEKIYKSKSTVGKYEQGLISCDVAVLLDIAGALDVPPQLFLAEIAAPAEAEKQPVYEGAHRYFYSYDGFSRRILRGLLVIASPDDAHSPVSLFYDIPSFDEPEKCRVLYVGEQECYPTVSKYLLRKRGGIESPQLVFQRPLDYEGKQSGMFFGISSRTQAAVSLKCILSDTPLSETPELVKLLHISAEDYRNTKKLNQFTLEPIF